MEGLLSLLLFAFFFIAFITRIIRFIIRVFKGIEEKAEDASGSDKSSGGSSNRKQPKTSRPAPGSRKGPPPGFELDLSEIDDKFGGEKGEQKKKPEVLESDTVKEYKARQEEKDKKDKKRLVGLKSRKKSAIQSGEIGGSGEVGHDLSFDNKSLMNGIIMKEILSPPRSLKPYKPVYKEKE
ncbi:hypothetical protein I0Q91_02895 [Halanaerobiaceae bacterium Z-7014]|uniref:Uncharacterized protein n=1 Tax=Halonatronomonas betaini TaxID=2778430 RepID=A0A931F9K1_9FIRM|nr:hypothetical protein [Halonatronomonas betaini]MBF8436017.1 hypothetical protein [Halonatronomonas betaini]